MGGGSRLHNGEMIKILIKDAGKTGYAHAKIEIGLFFTLEVKNQIKID